MLKNLLSRSQHLKLLTADWTIASLTAKLLIDRYNGYFISSNSNQTIGTFLTLKLKFALKTQKKNYGLINCCTLINGYRCNLMGADIYRKTINFPRLSGLLTDAGQFYYCLALLAKLAGASLWGGYLLKSFWYQCSGTGTLLDC